MRARTIITMIYALFLFGDFFFTSLWFNKPHLRILETNPIYVLTGSYLVTILLALGSILIVYYVMGLVIKHPFHLLALITIIVWLCVPKTIAMINSYQLYKNNPTVEDVDKFIELEKYDNNTRIKAYRNLMLMFFLIPLILNIIILLIFKTEYGFFMKEEKNEF